MKLIRIGALATAMVLVAGVAMSAPLKLQPANPQPNPKAGLNVKYVGNGTQRKIRDLNQAKQLLSKAQPGQPLRGLDYRDTNKGEKVLTFTDPYNVAAEITGYMHFDSSGVYELETWSNDGIEAWVGGQKIGKVNGIQGCEANQRTEVEVPQAGWYPLKIFYFQKLGTSCLMMKSGKKGERFTWTPNDVFGR
ncbi:PA14 domain-containing protein [Ruegeria sp. Ofav3-42]|uniref:PA14 domain-containing protein n=1 Tax=Ruegeria sp. Ofav3-42 TaxID=2917759 RepID=UPI001EF5139D|nr:PA14 domain-containing protein [Ruegeria sp. Ofav3-42]MCG7522692.1 PA14 domain-containing protein [Ruegeria sp. Ofav3-42]